MQLGFAGTPEPEQRDGMTNNSNVVSVCSLEPSLLLHPFFPSHLLSPWMEG